MDEMRNTGFDPENTPVPKKDISAENTEEKNNESIENVSHTPSEMPPFVPPYIPENKEEVKEESKPEVKIAESAPIMDTRSHESHYTYEKAPTITPDFTKSSEYRYVPPRQSENVLKFDPVSKSFNVSQGFSSYEPARQEPDRKKKEKKVSTFSTASVVFLLGGDIILSCASGICGALLVTGGAGIENIENTDKNDDSEKDKDSQLTLDIADDDEDNGVSSSDKLNANSSVSDVCAVVSASVVEITTEFNETFYGSYQYVQKGAGSGVIISKDGYIITNAHVITNSESGKLADSITIRLNSLKEYKATIIGSDRDSDIALLKIDAKNLSSATIGNSDKLKVGEQIIAVGNPLGELGGTVTSGIVSATNREITVENNKMTLIQIDAAINPGNSGGGLFNLDGELIGIVNAKTTDVTVEGLGFAIPVSEAIHVAEELESHGYVTGKTHIGISLADVTDAFTAYYYFNSQSTGVYISNVEKGYNENVLKKGDRITAIDDNEITSSADVKEIVQECKVGDKLIFTVSREGKLVDCTVTCYEYVPENDVSFEEEE